MTTSSKILSNLRHDGQVLHLSLNAPKGNVLDAEMMAAIERGLDLAEFHSVKLIVFEGVGSHFSFGASVEEHTKDRVAAMLESFHGLFRRMSRLAVPTMAVVRGQCLGGGLELASYCTWVIAGPDAKLGQPEIKLAVFAPIGSILLPWRVGGGAAADLLLSGRTIDATTALGMGLVNAVAEDPSAFAESFIKENVLPRSASSLRFAERAARLELGRKLEQDLAELERMYLRELMESPDANEGIQAFIEKRAPVFGAAKK